MLLLGQNGIYRGRSPLAFLDKLLLLFFELLLLISLERRVIYTIAQTKYAQNKEQYIKK